jgi:hypothetical protein
MMALTAGCVIAQSGCGEHVLLVTLENLSTEATSISAYFRIDQDSFRTSAIGTSVLSVSGSKFGIRPPEGRSGTLDVQVLAYKDSLPCALGKGSANADVSGTGPLSATAVLEPLSFSPCRANDAPVSYPIDAKIWASAPSNVWIAGKDAVVLHWDGSLFRNIALPDALLGSPKPTITAIRGDSQGNIWLTSESSTVFRLDPSGNAAKIPVDVVASSSYQLTFSGVYAESGSAVFSAFSPGLADGFIGVYSAATGKITATQATKLPTSIASGELHGVDCTSLSDCWFVGSDATVIHYSGGSYTKELVKSDSSCGFTTSLVDIQAVAASANKSQVKMVGKGGYFVAYQSTGTPCFYRDNHDSAGNVIAGDLLSISTRRPDEAVVVGQAAVYRWRTDGLLLTPGYEKGTWQSVSALSSGFFMTDVSPIQSKISYAALP